MLNLMQIQDNPQLLQRPVRLELFIKVEEDWRNRPDQLDRLGL